MEKQLTALAQSIARKKGVRIHQMKRLKTETNINTRALIQLTISTLEYEINEDEKLLAVDKEQIVSAFNEGVKICAVSNITKKEGEKPYLPLYGEIHYSQTFKND